MSEHLTCKLCGYKQYDEETCNYYHMMYPTEELHDIKYVCGACQNIFYEVCE